MSIIVFIPVRQFILLYNTELHRNNIGACDEINNQEMAGYKLGYYMVSNNMKKFKLSDFNDLLTAAPEVIYQNSSLE